MQAKAAFLQDPALGVSLYQNAFAHFSPYNAKQKLDCADLIVDSAINRRQSSQSFNAGSLVMQLTSEALATHPQDAAYYITLNDMYNGLALFANRDLARDAEVFGEKALQLSPKRQEGMIYLSRAYLIRNEPSRAVELNRRMLQYADFPLGRWTLGLSLLQNKQPDEAKREFRRAIETGYRPTPGDIGVLKRFIPEKEVSELVSGK
jgi:tetratricopeptide (TPR) repeat protein